MSDKHFSLKEWLKFAANKGYKDAPYQKALTAAQKTITTATLNELQKQSDALLKTHKADKPLQQWMSELSLDIKQALKASEKADSAQSDDGEDGADHAHITDAKHLLKQLNACRQDAERTIQFAYAESADGDTVLALSPRLNGRAMFATLNKATGSKKGAFGSLWVDGTTIALQLDKPLSGLVKKLRKPILASGFKYRLIQLMDESGAVFESDSDTASEPAAVESSAATAPSAATTSPAEQLKRLLPLIERQANSTEGKAAKKLVAECATLLKAGDRTQASKLIQQIEALLARQTKSNSTTLTSSSSPKPQNSKVAFTQTRLAWDSTRKHVQSELRKLEAAILSESANEPDFTDISKGVKNIYKVLDTLDERLIDILDDALNAEDATKQKTHHKQALAVVADYLAYVDGGDPFLEAIADNGFVELNLLSVLKERLAGMKQQLEAAAA